MFLSELWSNLLYHLIGVYKLNNEKEKKIISIISVEKTFMEMVINILSQIRSIRSRLNISLSTSLPLYALFDADIQSLVLLEMAKFYILNMKQVSISSLEYVDEIPIGIPIKVPELSLTLYLDVGFSINIPVELEKLNKDIKILDLEILKLSKMLENKNFIEKADSNIIEEKKNRNIDVILERDNLKSLSNILEKYNGV